MTSKEFHGANFLSPCKTGVKKIVRCQIILSATVSSKCPSAQVLSRCFERSSALGVSLNAPCVAESLNRCYWNKMLNIKRYFMYTEKDKIDKDDIEQLNFEAELER